MSHQDSPATDHSVSQYILIFGVAGSGKSSFIRKLVPDEQTIPVGNGILPETRDVQGYPINIDGKVVVLVDTPGTNFSDDILQDVQDWMGSSAISFDSILGIIFLQPITMNRVSMHINQQILDKFRGTGKGYLYRRIVLSTTKWSSQPSVKGLQEKREQSLQRNFWRPLVKRGAIAQRYDGTAETAKLIVRAIFEVKAPPPDPGKRAGIRDITSEPVPKTSQPVAKKASTSLSCRSPFKSYAGKFIVVLLGPSGSGRTSFIHKAMGREVKVKEGLEPVTKKIAVHEARLPSGKEVVLLDTPGYDLDGAGDRILSLLRQWVDNNSPWCSCFSSGNITISLFLFFYRMEEPTLPKHTQTFAKTFERMYEQTGILNRVHLVTTFWNQADAHGHARQQILEEILWREFLRGGSSIRRFDLESGENETSARGILDAITAGDVGNVVDLPIPASVSQV